MRVRLCVTTPTGRVLESGSADFRIKVHCAWNFVHYINKPWQKIQSTKYNKARTKNKCDFFSKYTICQVCCVCSIFNRILFCSCLVYNRLTLKKSVLSNIKVWIIVINDKDSKIILMSRIYPATQFFQKHINDLWHWKKQKLNKDFIIFLCVCRFRINNMEAVLIIRIIKCAWQVWCQRQ